MQTTKLAALTLAGLMSASAFAGTSDNGAMHDKDGHDSNSAMESGTHDDTMMDGKTTDDTDRTGLTTGAGTSVDGEPAGPGTETGTGVGNTTGTGNSATGN